MLYLLELLTLILSVTLGLALQLGIAHFLKNEKEELNQHEAYLQPQQFLSEVLDLALQAKRQDLGCLVQITYEFSLRQE